MDKFWITISQRVIVEKVIKAANMADALSLARNIANNDSLVKPAGSFGLQDVDRAEVTAVIKDE